MKLLPVIEWGCVAGLPILLCTKIVGLPPNRLWSALLSADEATDDDVVGVPPISLQWTVLTLVITSILSLVATYSLVTPNKQTTIIECTSVEWVL